MTEKNSRYRNMHLVRNKYLCNDVYKCTELHSSLSECFYYCLKGLLAIVVALLGLYVVDLLKHFL